MAKKTSIPTTPGLKAARARVKAAEESLARADARLNRSDARAQANINVARSKGQVALAGRGIERGRNGIPRTGGSVAAGRTEGHQRRHLDLASNHPFRTSDSAGGGSAGEVRSARRELTNARSQLRRQQAVATTRSQRVPTRSGR